MPRPETNTQETSDDRCCDNPTVAAIPVNDFEPDGEREGYCANCGQWV